MLVFSDQEGVIFYPELDTVFNTEDKITRLAFIPICSVKLSLVDPTLEGSVHFVALWGSDDGYAVEYDDRWMDMDGRFYRFAIDVDGKYSTPVAPEAFPNNENLAEWQEFARADFDTNREEYLSLSPYGNKNKNSHHTRAIRSISKTDQTRYFYVDSYIQYLWAKSYYEQNGQNIPALCFLDSYSSEEREELMLVRNIGEEPDWVQEDEHPIDENGNPLLFIGQLTTTDVIPWFGDEIYLFYDRNAKEVFIVQQFS